MQIPEMFSYVGMKDTKYRMKCFLFLPKNTKWKKELKLNTIATQAVYEHFFYIYLFASFSFCIYLYFYFHYLSTFKIKKKYFSYLSTINITYFNTFTQVIF